MKWFLTKKIKSKKDYADLKKSKDHYVKMCIFLEGKVLTWEKEAVYWKEKALNFRRFHQ